MDETCTAVSCGCECHDGVERGDHICNPPEETFWTVDPILRVARESYQRRLAASLAQAADRYAAEIQRRLDDPARWNEAIAAVRHPDA